MVCLVVVIGVVTTSGVPRARLQFGSWTPLLWFGWSVRLISDSPVRTAERAHQSAIPMELSKRSMVGGPKPCEGSQEGSGGPGYGERLEVHIDCLLSLRALVLAVKTIVDVA